VVEPPVVDRLERIENGETLKENEDDWQDNKIRKQARRDELLLSICGFSLYVIIEALIQNGAKYQSAAVVIGLLSLLLTVPKFLYNVCLEKIMAEMTEIVFGALLVINWTIGVVLLTFNGGIFFLPGTGYFSTWFCLILSGYYASVSLEEWITRIKGKMGAPVWAVIFGLNVAVMTQAIIAHRNDELKKRAHYAIAASTISLLSLATMKYLRGSENKENFFWSTVWLYILWASVVLTTTMTDPFVRTLDIGGGVEVQQPVANGFFATLGSFVACMIYVYKAHRLVKGRDAGYTRTLWLSFLFTTSFFVLVQSVRECKAESGCRNQQFLAVGTVISFLSCFISGMSVWFSLPNQEEDNYILRYIRVETYEIAIGMLLSFLWTAGAIALTFPERSLFHETSTGYFSIWGSFILSAIYLNHVLPDKYQASMIFQGAVHRLVRNKQPAVSNNYGMLISLVGMAVQVAASLGSCLVASDCGTDDFFVYIVAVVSVIILFFLLAYTPKQLGHNALLLILLFILIWYVSVAVITLKGPFVAAVGNGFYAGWAVLFGGVYTLRNYTLQLGNMDDPIMLCGCCCQKREESKADLSS